VPPKLWEAKIADLEALQRLKAARARAALSTEKIQGWEGIMVSFLTILFLGWVYSRSLPLSGETTDTALVSCISLVP